MGDLMEEEVVRDMTPRLVLDLGLRFMPRGDRRRTYGLYECQYCGKEFEAQSSNIKHGQTKSCGCQRKGINKTHGLTCNKFYKTWAGMLQRCNNPKIKDYKNYGARGITVCEEWVDVRNFVAWCEGTYIEGMTLDRIDNDKGYSPENCRWTTRTIQSINQRVGKNNKSGYVGVSWNKVRGMWTIRVKFNTKYVWLGHFDDLMEAVICRDNYIIENNLPHKLNLKQEKINEKHLQH